MAKQPKRTLASYSVKPSPTPPPTPARPVPEGGDDAKPVPEGGDDRKLTTLRFTTAQRRYLKQIALDENTTVQEWIVRAIDAQLASKGLGLLDSVKD
jgi:hypothetical protein